MTSHSFDVIIAADFRFPGGTSSAVAAEVHALRRGNYTVALYQINTPILARSREWNDRIVALVDAGHATVLPAGAAARCQILLAHSPWLFVDALPDRPQIESRFRLLVAHHSPTNANGRLNYDPAVVDENAARALGRPLAWAPISPVCRKSFESAGMTQMRLRDDWTNVVFVDDWGQARAGLLGERPVAGRHSRPQLEKWSASRAQVLAAFPSDTEVRLLGVGDQARALLEPLPSNWRTFEFGELPVRDFLAGIDFFVYFHHPDWIETFGLTIAEAAAAGCVVITHPYLEKTFGDAALYCPPEGAPALIRSIAQDPQRFADLSEQGRKAIDDRFGPQAYLRRFERLLDCAQDAHRLGEVVVQPRRSLRLQLRSRAKRFAYWSRNGISPHLQRILQQKAIRRPVRKIRKALGLR